MTAVSLPSLAAPADRSRTAGASAMLALFVIAALLSRVGFLARPFESDSGLYVYMGKTLVEGRTLYRDFYETKTPGVALFTAGLYRLFGDSWAPYVFLQAGMTLLAAWLLAREMKVFLGQGAVRPAFAFGLVFLNFSPVAYRGFQLETVQCFFACIAGAFALRALSIGTESEKDGDGPRRILMNCFLAGLMAGVAAMFKPTAAAVAGALMFTLLLFGSRRASSIVFTLIGLLVAPLLVFLWVWRAGLLAEMPPLFREISLYGSGTPIVPADWIKPAVAMVVGAFPFIIARICRSGATQGAPLSRKRVFVFFAVAWLILEALGVLLQRRMYIYHFLPVAPPLALLFGWACLGRRLGVYAVALTPILLISLFQSRGDFSILLKSGIANLPESDYLLAHASPGDSVVGDPLERVLMETHLRCGARYVHLFYFMNHDDAPLEYVGRFIEDIDKNQPKWAVFRTDSAAHRLMQCRGQTMLSENPRRQTNFLAAWARIDRYLAEHYQPVAQAGEMTVYQRR
jgi:hypothetical protein